jgi:hypothetical protein
VSERGGGEGLWIQSQEGQDLFGDGDPEQLIFKTSDEEKTDHLTNEDVTYTHNPSRFSDTTVGVYHDK